MRWLYIAVFAAAAVPLSGSRAQDGGSAKALIVGSSAIFSAAQTERMVEYYPGTLTPPFWTPTPQDAADIDDALRRHLTEVHNYETRGVLEHLSEYRKQLFGYSEDGSRFVLINGFCKSSWPFFDRWDTTLVAGADGGDCFFLAAYDATKKFVDWVVVNGPI
jgi:hypothetical protein